MSNISSGRLTLLTIAIHLDMSEARAQDVMRALRIDWKKAELDDVRTAYIRDIREKAAGRGGDEQLDLTRQRARQASADADLKELQYWRAVDELVAVADIEPRLASWAVAIRSEVLSATDKLLAQIESQHDIAIDREASAAIVASALAAIAAYPGVSRDDAGQNSDTDTAAGAHLDADMAG